MPEELTLQDLDEALAYLEKNASKTPDFHLVLPIEAMPDVIKAKLRWFIEHAYFSGNIEHVDSP